MRLENNNSFNTNGLIKLKDQLWLDKQRVAGKIAAKTLSMLKTYVDNKTELSLLELNNIAEKFITEAGGTPTFKGYKGFPAGVCISVNKELVHGIPKDEKLQEGDVVSFDLGVTFQGAIADTAITCIYGQPKSPMHVSLIQATEEALNRGIAAVGVGKRLGAIGFVISKFAKGKGFGVVDKYGGHGLDWNIPHAAPFVANKSAQDEGIRIQKGLSIAIEPMLTLGSNSTKTLDDGWTVVTNDIGAHFEHSIFVHDDHIEILTSRESL